MLIATRRGGFGISASSGTTAELGFLFDAESKLSRRFFGLRIARFWFDGSGRVFEETIHTRETFGAVYFIS